MCSTGNSACSSFPAASACANGCACCWGFEGCWLLLAGGAGEPAALLLLLPLADCSGALLVVAAAAAAAAGVPAFWLPPSLLRGVTLVFMGLMEEDPSRSW